MTIPDPLPIYRNHTPFRARCGTKFVIPYPQLLPKALADVLACEVCVYPKVNTITATECLAALATRVGRTAAWPEMIFVDLLTATTSDPETDEPCVWTLPEAQHVSLQWGTVSDPSSLFCDGLGWNQPDLTSFSIFRGIDAVGFPCPGSELTFGASVVCRAGSGTVGGSCSAPDIVSAKNLAIVFPQAGGQPPYYWAKPGWDGSSITGLYSFVNPIDDSDLFTVDGLIDGTLAAEIWRIEILGTNVKVGDATFRIYE